MPAKKASARKATRKPAKKAAPRKAPARKAPAKKTAGKKAAAKAPAKKAAAKRPAFGRPGTAGKADGDDAVQAWIAGVKPEHRPIVARIDALVGEEVPGVKRGVRWSSPMYGQEGQGWFASMASFQEHVRLSFFVGTSLDPVPPEGESKQMRGVRIRSVEELDERQVRAWIRQASKIRGWGRV